MENDDAKLDVPLFVNGSSTDSSSYMATNSLHTSQSVSTQSMRATAAASQDGGPKRLHVSNIPFRFRDPDLKALFEVH